jgi:mono/diheme cytochrome c family protein
MRIAFAACLAWVVGGPDDGCLAAFDAEPPATSDRRLAHELWVRECADCHGVVGAADGARSAGLDPPVPDLTDACRPVRDEWIARVILEGGASFNGNAAMRAYHELDDRKEVLAELVALVQGFRSQAACHPRERKPVVAPDQRD